MLTSLSYIFILGLLFSAAFRKLKLPGLLGMMITGMLLGPYALNLLDASILDISADLRQLALVIILTRAGLALDVEDLKKAGRPAFLMCFVPACFEIAGVMIIAPKLLQVSIMEAAIMGAVLAAVSPAVIVPRMIHLIEEGYGRKKGIPQLLLAGASVDDVFVIVAFTALMSVAGGESHGISVMTFLEIPVSIVLGVITGGICGFSLNVLFKKIHMRDSAKVLIILSISFLLMELEKRLEGTLPVSGLLAVMSMGIIIRQKYVLLAKRLSDKYNRLWVAAEVLLFALVGAAVDLSYVRKAGVAAIILIFGALLFRMAGVFVSLLKTGLNVRERIFCMIAYTPKATVQAAIGAIPLTAGLACGQEVLIAAVLSILITAPFGAFCIDMTYKKLLNKQ